MRCKIHTKFLLGFVIYKILLLARKKIKMIWEEEIKQAIQMGSPHFLQPWENTQQTDKFKDLSLLFSNADKFRNKKYFFLFTTGNKWAHFLEHYWLCKAAEQFSQPDTKFLRLVLMKTIPIWKLNSLTMHIFIFPFFFYFQKCRLILMFSFLKDVGFTVPSLMNVQPKTL